MGGLGVLAWLAIGAAAGWVITRLMIGAADDALRGPAAGVIGAVLGGLGMRLFEWSPALVSNDLNTSVAALAGSLWLTWITCVVTSGRQRGSAPPAADVPFGLREGAGLRVEGAPPVLTYAAARDQLVEQLLEGDRDVTDARVVARFDGGRHPALEPPPVQPLAARTRAG